MSKKQNTETYGLRVEKAIKAIFNTGEETIQYYITEDDLPLYEVNRWLEIVSLNSFKSGENYAYKLLTFLRFLKGKYQLHYRDVQNKSIIVDYVKYLLHGDEAMAKLEGKRSLHAVTIYVSVLKNFYEWLEDEKEVETNPVTYGVGKNKRTGRSHLKRKFLYGQIYNFDIEKNNITSKLRYKQKRSHIKWFSESETEKINEHLPTRRDKVIFRILLETGMRIGECLGLHLQHHNMHEGVLMVRKSKNIENLATVKTKERDLYITDSLNDEILDYIRVDRNEVDVEISDYLFLNHKGPSKGKAVEQRNYLKILKRAAEKAGFDPNDIITHAGRSTHAQHLLDLLAEGKITETYIKEEFGWESIDTLKHYIKGFDAKKRKEVSQMIRGTQDKNNKLKVDKES
ncbi:tyrosine-type recombinase/integrase [Bacillus thuringiensis]|uniref:tyrosine-type recombinase/integrase n=1 Tax=Bacillus thuringiensis TaxID=1428 RepID=UPI0021D68CFB|nr:site-specific integrase [Bacillus thuringiensis]MCU7667761.1 site-specific integrase [Bacillus thuringiensis]